MGQVLERWSRQPRSSRRRRPRGTGWESSVRRGCPASRSGSAGSSGWIGGAERSPSVRPPAPGPSTAREFVCGNRSTWRKGTPTSPTTRVSGKRTHAAVRPAGAAGEDTWGGWTLWRVSAWIRCVTARSLSHGMRGKASRSRYEPIAPRRSSHLSRAVRTQVRPQPHR